LIEVGMRSTSVMMLAHCGGVMHEVNEHTLQD